MLLLGSSLLTQFQIISLSVRKNFIGIEYSLWIERLLDLLHHFYGFLRFAKLYVVTLLESQSVFGADAALLQEKQSDNSVTKSLSSSHVSDLTNIIALHQFNLAM